MGTHTLPIPWLVVLSITTIVAFVMYYIGLGFHFGSKDMHVRDFVTIVQNMEATSEELTAAQNPADHAATATLPSRS